VATPDTAKVRNAASASPSPKKASMVAGMDALKGASFRATAKYTIFRTSEDAMKYEIMIDWPRERIATGITFKTKSQAREFRMVVNAALRRQLGTAWVKESSE